MGIGNDFIRQTSSIDFSATGRKSGAPQPPIELAYDRADIIPLPRPETIAVPPLDLRTAIDARRSVRTWSDESLTLDELSYLLWCTQGVQDEFVFHGRAYRRTVPSSGAKHSFETYMSLNRVDGIAPGLYRYAASAHGLICCREADDMHAQFTKALARNKFARNSAVILTWVAIVERMYWHHGERGYRNMFLDCGHVGQNAYLSAMQIGCGACTLCVFDDAQFNALLGLDGESAFVMYNCAVGKPRHKG